MTELCIRLNQMTPELDAVLPPTDSRRRPCLRALEDGHYSEVPSPSCLCPNEKFTKPGTKLRTSHGIATLTFADSRIQQHLWTSSVPQSWN